MKKNKKSGAGGEEQGRSDDKLRGGFRKNAGVPDPEDLYRGLFSTMSEGLASHDIVYKNGCAVDYIITDVNPAYEKILNLDRSKVVGKKASELYGTGNPPYLEVYARVAAGGAPEHFETYFSPMDKHFAISVFSPGQGKFLTVFQDITERKRVEKELHEREIRYRTVADNTYDFEFWINPQGEFLYASPSCKRMYGRESDEFFADPGLRRKTIHPDDQAAFDRHLARQEAHQIPGNAEFRIIRPDGTQRWISHLCQPVFDDAGTYIGVRGSNRDITERKDLELALQRESRKLDLLAESARLFLTSESPKLIVTNVCEPVMRFLDCSVFFNYLTTDGGNSIRLNAYAGIPEKTAREIEVLDFGVGVCGCVARDGTRIIAEDILPAQDTQTDLIRSLNISAYACHPLIYNGNTIGTLSFGTMNRSRFTDDEIDLMKAVTDLVSTAISRQKADDSLRKAYAVVENSVGERTSELHHAVEALVSERQRLYDVLETLPVYVCLLAPDYHMPFANRFFRERFGESRGRCCYDFLFGRTEPCEICETYTVLKTRAPHHWEWTGPEKRIYDIYDFPFTDSDGSFLIMEMGIDITERRKAEADLENHKNHLEDMVRKRTVELESTNARLQEEISQHNQAKEELLAKNTDLTAAFEELTAIQEELQQSNDELVRSEEELRKTSQYLENLISYANAPIIVWNPDFVITRFNRAFEDLTGRTAREIIGQRLEVLFPQQYRDASMQIIRKTMKGEQLKTVEIPILNRLGEIRTVLWNSATLYESDGKTVLSTIAQGNDITERKRAEAELEEKNEELRRAIEELTRKGRELTEALTEREILLSEIHHRVKNNLTAFISLLSLKGSYDETPAGAALKKDLQNRARSMALIHETLYRTGKFSQVDMAQYLTPLIRQISLSYDPSSLIKTVLDTDSVTLDLNRATPCGLIVTELITNSFKYAFPESFDCMNVRSQPCTISVFLKKDQEMCTLTISDNGIGIPPGIDVKTAQSLGLRLVYFLAKHQLKADVEVKTVAGTEIVFRFSDFRERTGTS